MLDVVVEDQSIKKRGVEAFYTTTNPSMGNTKYKKDNNKNTKNNWKIQKT